MRAIGSVVTQAFAIAVACGAIGVAVNLTAVRPAPWIYEPPKSLDLGGVKVTLIDEKQAREFLEHSETVFVDSRKAEDYAKSHVKGSVFFGPEDMHERFVSVEPLLPQEYRIVLYCYGPECEMAEQVGLFLVQLGYRTLAIMSPGFAAWEKAGYPVETEKDRGESLDLWEEDDAADDHSKIVLLRVSLLAPV
jgi:rhodanese-related sulfurtransferase